MKALKIFSVVLLCLLVITFFSNFSKPKSNRIDVVLGMKNFDQQRLAYECLLPSEKSEIWKNHIFNISKNMKLNVDQIELVNESYKYLRESNFIDGTRFFETNSDAIIFQQKVKDKFESKVAFQIFGSLSESKVAKTQTLLNPVPGCECNVGSSFNGCVWGSGGQLTCGSSECSNPTETGCGFFKSYPCNGKCVHGEN